MSQKVFKNADGKVLISGAGKVIKQSYDFGKAHSIASSASLLNCYVRTKSPIRNINDGVFSVMAYIRPEREAVLSSARGVYRFESSSYVSALGLGFRYSDSATQIDFNKTTELTYGTNTTIAVGTGQAVSGGTTFTTVFQKGICSSYVNNTQKAIDLSNTLFTTETYNYITIGRGVRGANSYETASSSIIANRVLVYDREISYSEHMYFHNNASGNEPQSLLDVKLDLHLNNAEILDFSDLQDGSDMRVGCRDCSGYHLHGEILNLPAGTLENKKDFANTHLFVNYIN